MIDRVLTALVRRTPTVLLLLVLPVVGLIKLAVVVVTHWWLAWPLLIGVVVWRVGPATVALVAGALVLVVAVLLVGWSTFAPSSWQRRLADPVRGALRARQYRRAWDDAMLGCKLDRAGIVPTLMSCRTVGGVDRLLVHLAPGQVAADWRDVAPRVAGALGVRSVRVRADGPRDVMLLVRWREIRLRDPEVADDAAVEAELAETTEQLVRERERELEQLDVPSPTEIRGAFPRAPR